MAAYVQCHNEDSGRRPHWQLTGSEVRRRRFADGSSTGGGSPGESAFAASAAGERWQHVQDLAGPHPRLGAAHGNLVEQEAASWEHRRQRTTVPADRCFQDRVDGCRSGFRRSGFRRAVSCRAVSCGAGFRGAGFCGVTGQSAGGHGDHGDHRQRFLRNARGGPGRGEIPDGRGDLGDGPGLNHRWHSSACRAAGSSDR